MLAPGEPSSASAPLPSHPSHSGREIDEAAAAMSRARATPRHGHLLTAIVVVGLALTASVTWAAQRADRSTEQRLLQVQTRQAAGVLSTAVVIIQQPLSEVLEAEQVVPRGQGASAFSQLMRRHVGTGQLFIAASLWRVDAGELSQVAALG